MSVSILDLMSLNPEAPVPLYEQLQSQIERLIISGKIRQGDVLPSVRQVAARFGINPMTVSKVYSNLMRKGWLKRQKGIGMIVVGGFIHCNEKRMDRMLENIKQIKIEASQLDVPIDDVIALLRTSTQTYKLS